jgi:hypothetical protein
MTPSLALALALAAAAATAQTTQAPGMIAPPPQLVASWVGSFQVTFALANASDPESWEVRNAGSSLRRTRSRTHRCATPPASLPPTLQCLPAGSAPITVPHSMTFSPDGTVADSSWPDVTVKAGPGRASYLWPGSTSYAFYEFLGLDAATGVVSLAYPGDPDPAWNAMCHFASVSASTGKLTFVTVGGAAISWDEQCDGSGYKQPENGNNPAGAPFCRALPGAASPLAFATSVVGTYTKGAASRTPSALPSPSATATPFLSTPSAPPSGIKLSSVTPAAAAPSPIVGNGSGPSDTVPDDGTGSSPGSGDGSGTGTTSGLDNGSSGSGAGTGAGAGGAVSPAPTSAFSAAGPSSSGAQGVASLASVAVAAFLGAAIAAAMQHRAAA